MSSPDLPVLISLAGAAVDQHVVEALARAGHDGLRPRHGYVVQRLLVGPATSTEMAAALDITQQAVSRTVAELVTLGYVETVVDPEDRRRRPVALTDHGRQVVGIARSTRRNLERRLRRRVGSEAAAAAGDVVTSLLDLLRLGDAITTRTVPMPPQS